MPKTAVKIAFQSLAMLFLFCALVVALVMWLVRLCARSRVLHARPRSLRGPVSDAATCCVSEEVGWKLTQISTSSYLPRPPAIIRSFSKLTAILAYDI